MSKKDVIIKQLQYSLKIHVDAYNALLVDNHNLSMKSFALLEENHDLRQTNRIQAETIKLLEGDK